MKLTELELSIDILRMSRKASFLASLAGIILFLNLPMKGLITYIIYGVLILFIIYALIIASKTQQNINIFNKNARKINTEELRNMVISLMDVNLKEERNDNIYFSFGMFIITCIVAGYSLRMNDAFMGISAFTFLFSSLSYVKTSILYQQLINKVIIKEKKLVKTIKSIKSPEF